MFLESVVAIGVLSALAWALGFRAEPRLHDTVEAARIVDEALTGFSAAEVALDAHKRAAVLRGDDGRFVVVRAAGDRWVVRVLDRGRARLEDSRLILDLREPGAPVTVLDLGGDAARWAALLA